MSRRPAVESQPEPRTAVSPVTSQRWRTSRLASTAGTFGPVGRIIWTAVLILPLWFAITFSGVLTIIFVPAYLMVLPVGLRSVWQRVRVERVLEPTEEITQPVLPPQGQRIADRPSPRRW